MNINFWDLYKQSERGKEAIALFTLNAERDNIEIKATAVIQKFHQYLGAIEDVDKIVDIFYLIVDSIVVEKLYIGENESPADYFLRLIDSIEICFVEEDSDGELTRIKSELPIISQKDYKAFCAILSEMSLVLYFHGSSFFFPMLFREQFDVFMRILDVLDIPMPILPVKADKRGRLLFYNDLNSNIKIFAEKYNLTPEECCACLYDFSSLIIEEDEKQVNLPEPTNIWLTGGCKEDYKAFLENPVKGSNCIWTCNENTKRGDIILIYVLSPYSCIQSIWRAEIDGVYTPFNFYNSRTRTTNGIVIPHITLKELKADTYFSQHSLTRKNFQGVNGVQFSAKDYKELQRLLTDKGFDTSVLPQLYNPDLNFDILLKNEDDVEVKLLIPLLEKLGFSSTDWSRKLSQKAGRSEKAIPDFVFMPVGETHFQNAPMVIEAKFNMSSNIERTKAYNQALSYARLMKSPTFGICDKERLIIYKETNGHFNRFNPIFEKHWQSINDAEIFNQLKLLIGRDAIRK